MTRKDYISLAIINRHELDSVDLNSVKMNLQSSTVNCIQILVNSLNAIVFTIFPSNISFILNLSKTMKVILTYYFLPHETREFA